MLSTNPYAAPRTAVRSFRPHGVEVVRRDRMGFRGVTQVYRFRSPLGPEHQLQHALIFYQQRGAELVEERDCELHFVRASKGYLRHFASHETKIPQTITVVLKDGGASRDRGAKNLSLAADVTSRCVCEVRYQFLRFFEFFVPPHHLEIEVGALSQYSGSDAC